MFCTVQINYIYISTTLDFFLQLPKNLKCNFLLFCQAISILYKILFRNIIYLHVWLAYCCSQKNERAGNQVKCILCNESFILSGIYLKTSQLNRCRWCPFSNYTMKFLRWCWLTLKWEFPEYQTDWIFKLRCTEINGELFFMVTLYRGEIIHKSFKSQGWLKTVVEPPWISGRTSGAAYFGTAYLAVKLYFFVFKISFACSEQQHLKLIFNCFSLVALTASSVFLSSGTMATLNQQKS